MKTLAEMKQQEAEFREFTRKWIEEQDKHYREMEQTEIAKKNQPIRHPKGKTHNRADRRYFWGDALFCQDLHSEPFELFFLKEDEDISEVADDQGTDSENGQIWEWFTNIFNEEFVKVCPDIKEVLKG